MKRLIVVVMMAGVLMGSCVQRPQHLTDDVVLGYTPVKNQDSSQLCWAYAMLAAIETEHIMRGDSVNLSVAFIERMMEQETEAPSTGRGTCLTALRLLQKIWCRALSVDAHDRVSAAASCLYAGL